MLKAQKQFQNRKARVRTSIKRNNKTKRVRLSVFRSKMNIYAQLIDDEKGITLASSSTLDKDLAKKIKKASTIEAAKHVGAQIAEKAASLNITHVVFDKGAYQYHGRIKALADAARESKVLNF